MAELITLQIDFNTGRMFILTRDIKGGVIQIRKGGKNQYWRKAESDVKS